MKRLLYILFWRPLMRKASALPQAGNVPPLVNGGSPIKKVA